ncbi:SMI1/KNR4 family protein [bacterium]|nr:MAG: SMI1/KNR4 family protein [bacterium]
MTDAEIMDAVQTAVAGFEATRDDNDDEESRPAVVGAPASQQQILECEAALGRQFSPSYRHFLSVYNGLRLGCERVLMGTEDYNSEPGLTNTAIINQIYFEIFTDLPFSLDVQWVRSLPIEVFAPRQLYRLLDGLTPSPAELQPLKDFYDQMEGMREDNPWVEPFFPRHITVSFEVGNDYYAFLDVGSRRSDGEMNFCPYYCDGGMQHWYSTTYDFLAALKKRRW